MNDLPGDALPASVFLYFETLEGHDNVSGVSYGATPLRGMKSIRLMHQKRACSQIFALSGFGNRCYSSLMIHTN